MNFSKERIELKGNPVAPEIQATLSQTSYREVGNVFNIEEAIATGLENGEFELYYQPQVDVGGVIRGAEALLRWKHPIFGMISPSEFIPVVEKTGQIDEITDWVIKHACMQLNDWKNRGVPLLPIAINLSPIRLMKTGLVEFVKQQLEYYQIKPTYLEVEITENSLLKNEKCVLKTLENLRELGISIAIDDFGTGYSSFEYLKNFQADILKIDQVFIQNMDPKNKKDIAIVSAILYLAKSLDMRITAEGVEKYEQFTFLKEKGCDVIQGFLFSKPVQVTKYEKLLSIGYITLNNEPIKYTDGENQKEINHVDQSVSSLKETKAGTAQIQDTEVQILDIGLRGMKLESHFKLQTQGNTPLQLHFTLLDETFDIKVHIRWKIKMNDHLYLYGIEFDLGLFDKSRLEKMIHKSGWETSRERVIYTS